MDRLDDLKRFFLSRFVIGIRLTVDLLNSAHTYIGVFLIFFVFDQ